MRTKEEKAAYMRAWHAANREKKKANQKAWRVANREKVSAGEKAYRAANREKVNAIHKSYSGKLPPCYIKAKLRAQGFTAEQLNKYPELIELKLQIIKTKRLCKTSKI